MWMSRLDLIQRKGSPNMLVYMQTTYNGCTAWLDLPIFDEHGEKFRHFFLKKCNAVYLMAKGSKSLALDVSEGVIIEITSVVRGQFRLF